LGVVVQRPSLRSGGNASRLCRCVALFVVFTMFFAWSGTDAADTKRVVLLHSFGQGFKPWSEYARSIRSELQRQSPWQLDITDLSLVTARSSDEDPEVPFVAYLNALFAKQRPDLIVGVGAPAAAFVQRHRPQLFPNTPMVLTAVDERRVQFSSLSENDSVVAVRIDYLGAIENILQVLPGTKHVMVVVGTSPIEQFWREEIGKAVKPLKDRVSFTWTNNLSFDDLLKHAAALPPHSAIFWELMIVDAAGVVHQGNTALARLHAVSNAPIFSYDESFFGREIVGGPFLAVLDSSHQTAAVAIRILGGEKASDIKTPSVQFSTPRFDWREMRRWGISENRLLPASQVEFREPTAWQRYRWQLTTIFITLLAQMAVITWLLIERRARRTAQLEARQRLLEVMHLNRTAEAGALSASFAHELSQPLEAAMLNAETVERLLTANPPEQARAEAAIADTQQAIKHAADIIQHLKKLLKRRSDPLPQDFNLNEAIADALRILSPEAAKRRITLSANGIQQSLPVRADRIHIQQVVLNLATNAMDAMTGSASDARAITIQTSLSEDSQVEVSVTDSGMGIADHELGKVFDTFYTTKKEGTGLGLSIARTIVENYGGHIWAENRIEGGAVFRFTLPLLRPA
jgi:signal transduction histidine kinase